MVSMNKEDNQDKEEGLQKDVALEPFLEDSSIEEDLIDDASEIELAEDTEFNQMQDNSTTGLQKNPLTQGLHGRKEDTVLRIHNALNQHHQKVNAPQPNPTEGEAVPNEGKEQNNKEGIVDQVAQKAVATGISAATGGTVPPKLAEAGLDIIKKLKPKVLSQRILEFLGIFPKSITDSPILSRTVLSLCCSIIVVILIAAALIGIGRGDYGKKELSSYLAYGLLDEENGSATLVSYLQKGGWCNSTLDCVQSSGYRFLTTFRRKILEKLEAYQENNKENECLETLQLNEDLTSLLLGTLFYNRSNDELLSSESLAWKWKQYEEEMDYIIEALYEEIEMEDTNSQYLQNKEDKLVCYNISKEAYKEAIVKKDGYIDRYRSDIGIFLSEEKKLKIYEEILKEISKFMNTEVELAQGTYIECSGITVVDKNDNVVGTYSLEDYVAGVISGEMTANFPEEAKKALAVAARTYVLADTNSCTKPIESSSRKQNFNPNIRDDAKNIANETTGQILVDASGELFKSEYDSWFCIGRNSCIYEKEPNRELHEVTISDKYLNRAAGGHGRGMSQIAAADMADKGNNYQTILKFFYSDGVQISTLTKQSGMMKGTKYISTAPLHSNVDDLFGNQFYNPNAKNLGQCVWYARSRAQEILYYSNMPEELKQIAINSIRNTYGNGEAWYRNPDGSIFAKSTDVTQPRVGAIVSWSGGVSGCTPRCGHVAIIESVNADGTVTISEGWKAGNWSSMAWSSVRYRKFNATIDYIKFHTNSSGDPYYFNGYVYLLG